MFPVFVILINSFKTRKAIFPRTAGIAECRQLFSLIGYETVLKQGDFLPLLPELDDRHRRVPDAASCLFGAMAAFALAEYRFKGNTLMGLYLALGIMIPIRIGTVAILGDDGFRPAW